MAVAAKIQVVWLSVKRVQLLEFYTRPLHDLLVQFGSSSLFFVAFQASKRSYSQRLRSYFESEGQKIFLLTV